MQLTYGHIYTKQEKAKMIQKYAKNGKQAKYTFWTDVSRRVVVQICNLCTQRVLIKLLQKLLTLYLKSM